ncbi:hypothetical protein GCM10009756_06710 [Pseudokineococcus marinus]
MPRRDSSGVAAPSGPEGAAVAAGVLVGPKGVLLVEAPGDRRPGVLVGPRAGPGRARCGHHRARGRPAVTGGAGEPRSGRAVSGPPARWSR